MVELSVLDLFIDRMDKVAKPKNIIPTNVEDRTFTDPFERPTYLRHLDPGYRPRKPEPDRRFSIEELAEGAVTNSDWRTWYTRHSDMLKLMFGADHEVFKTLLALTSPNQSVPGNISMALKAYKHILLGLPIDESHGFLQAHSDNINKMLHGMEISGPKVAPFEQAMYGKRDAVPIDLHMLEVIYGKPNKSGLIVGPAADKGPLHKYATEVVKQVADRLGWDPTETQAALWAFNFELRKVAGTRNVNPVSFDTILARRADDAYITQADGVRTQHPPINEEVDEWLNESGGPYIEKVRPDKSEQFKQEQRDEFADTEANIGDIVGDIPVEAQKPEQREEDIASASGRRKV